MNVSKLVVPVFLLFLLTVFVLQVPLGYCQPQEEEEEEEHIQARPNPLEQVTRPGQGQMLKGETQGKAERMLEKTEKALTGKAAVEEGNGPGGKVAVDDGNGPGGKVAADDGQGPGGKVHMDLGPGQGGKISNEAVMDDGQHDDGKVMDDGKHGAQMIPAPMGDKTVSDSMNVFNSKAREGQMNMDPTNMNAGSLEEEFGGNINIGP